MIKVNSSIGIKKPKAEKEKDQVYDANEAQVIIKALYNEPIMWRLLLLGAIIGGFRRGEVALERPNVLFNDDAIHI